MINRFGDIIVNYTLKHIPIFDDLYRFYFAYRMDVYVKNISSALLADRLFVPCFID